MYLSTVVRVGCLSLAVITLGACTKNEPIVPTQQTDENEQAQKKETKTVKKVANEKQSNSYVKVTHGRAWGPEQATGAPDTLIKERGDAKTAWASLTEDKQQEWLKLEYEDSIDAVSVLIYETFNPGAVTKVVSTNATGQEKTLWEGKDPGYSHKTKEISVSELPLNNGSGTRTIKLYIDSVQYKGWNEIDAVGLKDKNGKVHWAVNATASSAYTKEDEDNLPVWCCTDTSPTCIETVLIKCEGKKGTSFSDIYLIDPEKECAKFCR